MGPAFLRFLHRWIITTLAVVVAANIVRPIEYSSWWSLLGASLLLGVVNALLRPLLMILSLPLVILTLGFFALIINALLLRLVAFLIQGFEVPGFWPAFWGAVVIGLTTLVLNTLTGSGKSRIDFSNPTRRRPPKPGPPPGPGPVIDV